MLRRDAEVAVFRDLEKFYRVLGYYEGQKVKPLEAHERFVEQNLEDYLRNPSEYVRRLQYDLDMTVALCQKRVIYETEKPELSLVYALFSEGIQALIVLRDLSGFDLREWCELVRRTLIEFDQGSTKDLASVLWRSPSRNLRARIYNSLLDIEADAAREVEEKAKKSSAGISADPSTAIKSPSTPSKNSTDSTSAGAVPSAHEKTWHTRDQDWDVPEGENVARDLEHYDQFRAQKLVELRQALETLEVNSSLPPDFRLTSDEISNLSYELSACDQDHIDFNLLNWSISVLENNATLNSPAQEYARLTLSNLAKAVVGRFHPGLIFFLLEKLKTFKSGILGEVKGQIEAEITKSLSQPANQKRLLASLRDSSRAQVTKKLLPYLDPKQFSAIVDFYLEHNDREGLVDFLIIVVQRPLPHEQIFFGWGDDRLVQVLPLFRRMNWPGKYEFLKRAVRSRSEKIAKQACYYIINIPFEADQAIATYKVLSDEARETWLRSLLESPPKDNWRSFVAKFLSTDLWFSVSNRVIRGRLVMGWAEIAFKYLGEAAVTKLAPWISARKLWLWPRYPEIREACLLTLIQQRQLRTLPAIQEIIRREARVSFQNPELKAQLKAAEITG